MVPRSCGWGGIAFEPDEDGVVEVPTEAVGDLLPFGFRPVPPKPEPKLRRTRPAEEVMLGGMPGIARDIAPGITVVTPVQGTDRAGSPFEKDLDGTPHPDA